MTNDLKLEDPKMNDLDKKKEALKLKKSRIEPSIFFSHEGVLESFSLAET